MTETSLDKKDFASLMDAIDESNRAITYLNGLLFNTKTAEVTVPIHSLQVLQSFLKNIQADIATVAQVEVAFNDGKVEIRRKNNAGSLTEPPLEDFKNKNGEYVEEAEEEVEHKASKKARKNKKSQKKSKGKKDKKNSKKSAKAKKKAKK